MKVGMHNVWLARVDTNDDYVPMYACIIKT